MAGRGSFAHYLKINANADEPALDRVTIFCKPLSTGFLLLPENFCRFSATIKLRRFWLSFEGFAEKRPRWMCMFNVSCSFVFVQGAGLI